MLIVTQTSLLAILTELIAVGNYLDGAKIGLYQNNFSPTPQTVLADLTVADYTGYALSAAVVWGTPYVALTGLVETVGPMKQFQPTGTTVGNTIYGYYIVDTAGTGLIFAEKLATPVPLFGPTQALPIIPRFAVGQVVA